MPNPYHDRTTQKLQFSRLYLDERLKCENRGSIPERAHEESFLYHLIGVKDSFLQEVNYALALEVPEHLVKEKSLRAVLKRTGQPCQALDEIETLRGEKGSWMNLAIWFRNLGTHQTHIPRGFHRGGTREAVFLTNPYTREEMPQTITEFLADCFDKMVELIPRLRATLP